MEDQLKFLQSAHEDDFVQYIIFPPVVSNDPKEIYSSLKTNLENINKIVSKYAETYLWHRDCFKLICRNFDSNLQATDAEDGLDNLPPHLYGISHYGDNIEDEWFIVFLLHQITKEIEGTVARVIDSDGEFLFIEAADYLPQWANPETCEKRIFIYQGALHIIPPKYNENLSLDELVSELRHDPTKYIASTNIQNCIINRIKGYPERILNNLHAATLYLPVGVASLLKHKSRLVAPAVQAFCNRDSIDLKACRAMKYFPPESRVYTRVTFTKCLYAMLAHSRYVPDKRTGWNLPLINSPQYKSHSLGANLACGFEILVSQARVNSDVESDRGWNVYIKSLIDKNYFQGLLEHSHAYNDLLNKAKEYYMSYRDTLQSTPVIGQEILQLTKNLDFNLAELHKAEENIPKDDDDSWLNIDPNELDKMLEDKYGCKKFAPLTNNTDATSFTGKITQFLEQVSEIEGAEFPNESPVRPPRGVKRRTKSNVSFTSDTKPADNLNTNKVNFDPSAFNCALQNILDLMIPEDTWDFDSDSDMSEYGQEQEGNVEDNKDLQNKMVDYMNQMDKELSSSTIGQSFKNVEQKNDTFEDVESFQPVDIDMNALKNILESYQAEMGESGPASNMLGPMGVYLQPGTSQQNHINGGTD